MSIARGRQRTCPVVAGRRFKRDVWALWTSADGGGGEGGELSADHSQVHARLDLARNA